MFDGFEISFSDIKTAYGIVKISGTSRAMLKITDSYINYNIVILTRSSTF